MTIQQMLLGGAGESGYNLTRSLRFRASASANLTRTPAGSSSQSLWTWSAWVKRGQLGAAQTLFSAYAFGASDYQTYFGFTSDDKFQFYNVWGGASSLQNLITTQVFRDPSAWYHIVVNVGMAASTFLTAIQIFINGVQVTSFSTNSFTNANNATAVNSAQPHGIGVYATQNTNYFDGYLAEVNFVNGSQLLPISFGSTNALTGVWQPARYTGSYGTNGFYLPFTDNSTAAALGTDFSGNSNTWTVNNISVTAGVTYDSMTDVPTLTSATTANYAVWNPLNKGANMTLANGNLRSTASGHSTALSTIGNTSGKWYLETTIVSGSVGGLGFTINPAAENAYTAIAGKWWVYDNGSSFNITNQASNVGYAARFAVGQVWQIALDIDNGKCFIGVNNSWIDSTNGTTGNPATGANPTFTFTAGTLAWPFVENGGGITLDTTFGQRPFAYTPPTGFVALNTFNLPAATIAQGNTVMDATLWTGNGAARSITNAAAFQPDLVWIKGRSATTYNILTDSVRGTNSQLFSNDTLAQESRTDRITAFNSNGFSLGNYNDVNTNAATYVGWQWQAGQGTTSSNTDGSITSTVSVNPTAGFSVVTYTGTGANATVGHGLGVAPRMIIVKDRVAVTSWQVYHRSLGGTDAVLLNSTGATFASSVYWNNTNPTSSVFSIGTSSFANTSSNTYVAYCWSEIDGFSKFGSYTGNGSSDGPFVYCGFRPKFILLKNASGAFGWTIWDTSRNTYNVVGEYLVPNASDAAATNVSLDILSNGFKLRDPNSFDNGSGNTMIFAAFAENPLKHSLAR